MNWCVWGDGRQDVLSRGNSGEWGIFAQLLVSGGDQRRVSPLPHVIPLAGDGLANPGTYPGSSLHSVPCFAP
jgi:hypothetical protein